MLRVLGGDGSGRRIIRNPLNRPSSAGEQRDEQRHLERERPRVLVDAQDLLADLLGLAGEQRLELRVAHHLRVVLERLRRPASCSRGGQHGAVLGHVA